MEKVGEGKDEVNLTEFYQCANCDSEEAVRWTKSTGDVSELMGWDYISIAPTANGGAEIVRDE